MAKLLPIKLSSDSDGLWTVSVGGHNLANTTTSLTLDAKAGGRAPDLTLRIDPMDVAYDGPASVLLDEPTTAALKAMGWTAPSAEPDGTQG